MSTQSTQKRKRSIQDAPTDLMKMQLARRSLSALKEDLSGIEESKTKKEEIMKHVDALQGILGGTEKLKIPFSSVQRSDLSSIGLERRFFSLNEAALQAGIAASGFNNSKHIEALCSQITRIRRSVSKRPEAGARMIFDAFLLTIADISLEAKVKLHVAIFPDMRITSGDGVLVKNVKNQFELWLVGDVDYGICTYEHEIERQQVQRDHVLDSTLEDLTMYTRNRIMLIEAKRDKQMVMDSMPEAISQAIALSEVTGDKTVRYCLSNGNEWRFLLYTCDDQGNRISYEGPILTMRKPYNEAFVKEVRCLVALLYHWLRTDDDIKFDPLCVI